MAVSETVAGAGEMIIPLENFTFVHLMQMNNFILDEGKNLKTNEIYGKNERPLASKIDCESKLSKNREKLNGNKNIDTSDKRFQCPLCQRSFTQKYLGKFQNSVSI